MLSNFGSNVVSKSYPFPAPSLEIWHLFDVLNMMKNSVFQLLGSWWLHFLFPVPVLVKESGLLVSGKWALGIEFWHV